VRVAAAPVVNLVAVGFWPLAVGSKTRRSVAAIRPVW